MSRSSSPRCPWSSRAGARTRPRCTSSISPRRPRPGRCRSSATLATAQAASGHAVTLAYADRPETPADLAQLGAAGVEPIALPWARRSPRSHLAAARALRRLVGERQPDLVHLHSSFAGAVGALALPRGTVLIYTPHGLASARTGVARPASAGVRALEALVARRCALLGAVSEAEAEIARARPAGAARRGGPQRHPRARRPAGAHRHRHRAGRWWPRGASPRRAARPRPRASCPRSRRARGWAGSAERATAPTPRS